MLELHSSAAHKHVSKSTIMLLCNAGCVNKQQFAEQSSKFYLTEFGSCWNNATSIDYFVLLGGTFDYVKDLNTSSSTESHTITQLLLVI